MYISNPSVCAWSDIVFPFVYSVIVYHGCNSADISPLCVGTLQNIFPISKHLSNPIHFDRNFKMYCNNFNNLFKVSILVLIARK